MSPAFLGGCSVWDADCTRSYGIVLICIRTTVVFPRLSHFALTSDVDFGFFSIQSCTFTVVPIRLDCRCEFCFVFATQLYFHGCPISFGLPMRIGMEFTSLRYPIRPWSPLAFGAIPFAPLAASCSCVSLYSTSLFLAFGMM